MVTHASRMADISALSKNAAVNEIEKKIYKAASRGYTSISLFFKTAAEDTIFFGKNIEPVLKEVGYSVKKTLITKSKWEFTISW